MRWKHVAAWVALAGAATSSCSRREVASPGAAAPVVVRVMRPAGRAGEGLVLPARVSAQEEVTVTSRLAARLTSLPLREGDRFVRGGVLARFDAPESRAALAAADAVVGAASVRRDLARRQESRMDSLLGARVAAKVEAEAAQAESRAAEAAFAQAAAQREQFVTGTMVTAPFDGVVVRRRADVGTELGPGQPLLDIRSARGGEIVATVPESELPRLAHAGAVAQIGDGAWFPIALGRLDGMTDFSSRSRIARFRAADGAPREPGAFARVRLPQADGAAGSWSSVPASALVRRGGLAGVFVAEDGVARLRWLRVGRESEDAIEVLAGLGAADSVIDVPAGLEDGRAIRVVR